LLDPLTLNVSTAAPNALSTSLYARASSSDIGLGLPGLHLTQQKDDIEVDQTNLCNLEGGSWSLLSTLAACANEPPGFIHKTLPTLFGVALPVDLVVRPLDLDHGHSLDDFSGNSDFCISHIWWAGSECAA